MRTKPLRKPVLGRLQPLPKHSPKSVSFLPGPSAPCRLLDHYHTTLASDLMVLTYSHHDPSAPAKTNELRQWDGSSPYHINRANRPLRGNKQFSPLPRPITFRNIPALQKVVVHTMVKEALGNESALLSARLAIQSITGSRPSVVHAKTGLAPWKLRVGVPVATKVTLTGRPMYHFLSTLVEIVMPKLKDYPGVRATTGDGAGNVSFGFPPEAMAMFPEIEANYDMYPSLPGFHVNVETTATTDRDARLLISALGIPLYGKEKESRR